MPSQIKSIARVRGAAVMPGGHTGVRKRHDSRARPQGKSKNCKNAGEHGSQSMHEGGHVKSAMSPQTDSFTAAARKHKVPILRRDRRECILARRARASFARLDKLKLIPQNHRPFRATARTWPAGHQTPTERSRTEIPPGRPASDEVRGAGCCGGSPWLAGELCGGSGWTAPAGD
jgi:hypothetical protein